MTKTIKRYISILLTICLLFTNIVTATEQKMSAAEKLEYIEKGEKLIDEFYNPSSYMYFGKKLDIFFTDDNLKQVKTLIEQVAKARGVSTKQVMTDVMGHVFTEIVFGDLTRQLAAIQLNYKNSTTVGVNLNDPSVSKAVAIGAGGLLGTLGIATAVLGIWGAMTAPVAGLWTALVIWWTGAAVGWKAAIAMIVSGPWGWIVLVGMLVATGTGYAYYQIQAENSKKAMIETLKIQIDNLRPSIVNKWRESFASASPEQDFSEADKRANEKMSSFFETTNEMFIKSYSDGKMQTNSKSLAPDKTISEMVGFVSAEANFIFVAKVNKLMEKPLVHKYINENYLATPEIRAVQAEFISRTGLNALEDIHEIVIFASGTLEKRNAYGGAILKGRFNANLFCEGISKDANALKDLEITQIDGFDAIIPKNKNDGFALFLDEKTAVIGSEKGVMATKDVKLGKKQGIDSRTDFFAVLNKFNINAHLSGAGLLPQDIKEKIKANPNASPLADINYYFFELDLDSGLKFNFCAEVNKIQNVDSVKTFLNDLLAMLKIPAQENPATSEIYEILQMIKVNSKETSVTASIDLSNNQLEELFLKNKKATEQ